MTFRTTRWTRFFSALVLALCVLARPRIAFAQTPAPAAAPEPPPRLEASAQFTFLDTRGNSSTQSLGAGGDFVFRPDPWTYKGKAIFAQSEDDDEITARSVAALFRTSRAVNKHLSLYGQYDFLRDTFAGIERRHVIEGGASYLAVDREPHRLQFDAGLGYLNEGRIGEDLESATVSLAAAYRFAVSTMKFTYEPRFLLPLSETDAWKFEQDVAFAVALNSILSLKIAHTLRHSADPPAGFETTDRIMTVSLVARMKRPKS
jgi:putative salt-induced outer membrane protein YdiY